MINLRFSRRDQKEFICDGAHEEDWWRAEVGGAQVPQ